MFDWIKRLFSGADELKDGDVSAGGSRIYKYGGDVFENTIGVDGHLSPEIIEKRDAVYEEFFGPTEKVYHEVMPFVPHIDIYAFEPGHNDRDFWTLVTSGMSNLPMAVPDDIGAEFARAELIFYCNRPEEAYLEVLRVMAHFPHDNETWFGLGHTVPNGNPPSPFFRPNSKLTTLLFLMPLVEPDASLSEHLVIDGDPVNFLWPVPISDAECDAKLEHGVDYLLDLFQEVSHPVVFTGDRDSYC